MKLLLSVLLFQLINGLQEPEFYEVTTTTPDDKNCTDLLQHFAENSAKFSYCAIMNSRPVKVCENCVEFYIQILSSYDRILTGSGELDNCSKELFDLDRLQVLRTEYYYSTNLWTKAECDTCFVFVNGTLTPTVTQDTKNFVSHHKDITDCLKLEKLSEVCSKCLDKYLQVNAIYDSFKKKNQGAVCMDVVDMMNITRKLWSGDLQCCKKREHNEVLFLRSAGVVIVVTLLFYVLTKYMTKEIDQQVPSQTRFADTFRILRSRSHVLRIHLEYSAREVNP